MKRCPQYRGEKQILNYYIYHSIIWGKRKSKAENNHHLEIMKV